MRAGHPQLRHLLLPLAASLLASAFLSTAANATANVTAAKTTSLNWHAVPVQPPPGGVGPAPGGVPYDVLSTGNITCLSPSDCVVAGSLEDSDAYPETSRLVIWRWDGKVWGSQSTGTSADGALVGTACASPTDCWATGAKFIGKQLSTSVGLIEHYNGKSWAPFPLTDADGVALNSVSCTSPSDCLAAGNRQTATKAAHALAYLWDGKTWTALAPLSPLGALWTVLDGIDCFSPNDCIAVGAADNSSTGSGYFFSERFNGKSWSLISMPNNAKFDMGNDTYLNLSCASANICLAAGSAWHYTHGEMGMNDLFGLNFSWDGKSWASRAWDAASCFGLCPGAYNTKNPLNYERFYYPAGASCTAPGNCWASLTLDPLVGDGDPSQGMLKDDITFAHWDGASFQLKRAPVLGFFSSIGCLPTSGGTWCIGLGETGIAWAVRDGYREPAKVSMVGAYFTAPT
jgi:hypothetical protein